MERIKELDRFQKIVLLIVCAMLVVFTVLYAVTTARQGFAYGGNIFTAGTENGATVYTGKLDGLPAQFRLEGNQSVTLTCDGRTYGPYTAREDPTARPDDMEYTTGVEILDDGEIFFRGGVYRSGDGFVLFKEDGGISLGMIAVMSDGTAVDGDGNTVDTRAPSAAVILELLDGPELTHKGIWFAWLCGAFMCAMTAVSILFADELFRWNMSFKVENPDAVYPSDWVIAGRYISWAILPILTLGVFAMGLNVIG